MRRLPAETAKQREELVRLINTPLPSAEDRDFFAALLGSFSRRDDPLRANQAWLREYLKTRPAPDEQEKQRFVAALKTNMLFVQGGSFIMGDFGIYTKAKTPINSDRNNPPHKVTLDSYGLMKGRVTYGEYDFYARTAGRPMPNIDDRIYLGERYPGYTVRPILWADADGYCKWLGKFTQQPFALPTDAQWEYAARERGKFVAYPAHHMPEIRWANQYIPFFDSLDEALQNIKAKAGRSAYLGEPRPAGLYGANRIGMQDVIGGTYEWVADWYDPNYFKQSPERNPQGPSSGEKRVVRPSAYGDYRSLVVRRAKDPLTHDEQTQFRCALNSPRPWQ